MSQATPATIKKGANVKFQARVNSGLAKVVAIRQSARGNWYDVATKDGKQLSLRRANISPV